MTTELNVTGMTCGHCRSAVQRALTEVEGVDTATVDLEAGVARVEGDAKPEALVAAVQKEGYGATVAGAQSG
ncbi:MAG: heavy-metal-associated domain-containing protein [Deinococcota bacterium]|nr:heavy-metal-associated domain-containing protein [Deinococcota bacterium]